MNRVFTWGFAALSIALIGIAGVCAQETSAPASERAQMIDTLRPLSERLTENVRTFARLVGYFSAHENCREDRRNYNILRAQSTNVYQLANEIDRIYPPKTDQGEHIATYEVSWAPAVRVMIHAGGTVELSCRFANTNYIRSRVASALIVQEIIDRRPRILQADADEIRMRIQGQPFVLNLRRYVAINHGFPFEPNPTK